MGIGRPERYKKEKITFNLARLKKGGQIFEVVVDPEKAIAYKTGQQIDLKDVLKSEKIFSNAIKGIFAQETLLTSTFNSKDPLKVAEIILKTGQVQFTKEYREELRENKRKRIVYLIHQNTMDPRTKTPHPPQRIESAMEQAKVKISELKTAEEQIGDIVKKILPIIPIKMEKIIVAIDIQPKYSHQSYGVIKNYGPIKQTVWGPDGGLSIKIEIPAGIQEEIMERLNKLTRGTADMNIITEKNK